MEQKDILTLLEKHYPDFDRHALTKLKNLVEEAFDKGALEGYDEGYEAASYDAAKDVLNGIE